MDTKRNSFSQLSLMILITIITQFFIILKNSIVASRFGVSTELDAFNFASNISTFVYSFIGAGISTILMPNLGEINKKKSINIFVTIIYSIAIFLLVLLIFLKNSLLILLSGSNDIYFISICSNVFIATLISGFLNSILSLVSGVLEYKGQFNRLRFITLLTSILIIFLLLLKKHININYYAICVLITAIVGVIFNLFFLIKSGFKFQIDFNIKDKYFVSMIKLFVPVILSQGVYQISILIDTMISSRLGVGQVSTLNYSNSIIGMINLLFLSNITSFLYPKLIRESKGDKFHESFGKYITIINALMCVLMSLFFILGKEGISLLYERGSFSSHNTEVVYFCTLFYIISLPTNAIRDLIYRYFYINNDTFSPFINSILVSFLNIIFSIVLSQYIGLYGVVLGTTLASTVSLAFITIRLMKKFSIKFVWGRFLKVNIKTIVSTIFTIIFCFLIKNNFPIKNIFLDIMVYGLLVISIFTLLLSLIKSPLLKIKSFLTN